MLAHDMAHLAALDPLWWMISDAIIALAWWHPLVWWARRQLQSAQEAAADDASVLIPGGARALAECLVRLGRELTAPGPARALGIGGNGPRSLLAARVERLLREPRAWQPLSLWGRWTPQVSALFVALASALLPVQTGLSGSILAMLATTAPARGLRDFLKAADTGRGRPASSSFCPAAICAYAGRHPKYGANPICPSLRPHFSHHSIIESAGRRDICDSCHAHGREGGKKQSAAPRCRCWSRFVSLPEHAADDLGLDWFFGLEPANNPNRKRNQPRLGVRIDADKSVRPPNQPRLDCSDTTPRLSSQKSDGRLSPHRWTKRHFAARSNLRPC